MTASIISFNYYKECLIYQCAINDRKRLFLKMLGSVKIENQRKTLKEKFLSYIGYHQLDSRNIDDVIISPNPIISRMSDSEFAILRSILDGDYSLLGFEKLSSGEQNNFLIKCVKIFSAEGKLTLNAYIAYCKRKCENYGINNFGDA